MGRRTLTIQNQIRSTASGIEFDDTVDLAYAETTSNLSPLQDPISISGTLIMDMNFIRTSVRDIKGAAGEVSWFDSVVESPGTFITLSGARGALNNVYGFIGSSGDFDSSPNYDTLGGLPPFFVAQGDSVNVAIEKLDTALATASGGGVSLAGHEKIDSLVHNLAETGTLEITRSGSEQKVTRVEVLTVPTTGTLIRSTDITRSGGQVTIVVENQHDEAGVIIQTLTSTINRVDGKVVSVDTVET